jgi:hypothetical protein
VFTDALQLTARIVNVVEANPELAATYLGVALLVGVVATAITGCGRVRY